MRRNILIVNVMILWDDHWCFQTRSVIWMWSSDCLIAVWRSLWRLSFNHDYKCSQLGFKAVAWTPTVNFHDRQKAANLFLLSQYCLFERFIGHNPPDWNVKVMDDAYLIHVRSSGYRGDVWVQGRESSSNRSVVNFSSRNGWDVSTEEFPRNMTLLNVRNRFIITSNWIDTSGSVKSCISL